MPPTPTADTSLISLLAPYVAAGVALVAAVVSYVASRSTNKNAGIQQQRQLAHDSQQRDRERTLALRRDVYIPVVRAIVHAQSALGQMIDPDTDHNVVAAGYAEDVATMAKIHAVGSEQSIGAVLKYLRVLGPAYLRFMVARGDLLARKRAIAQETAGIEHATAAIKRFQVLAGELHLAGEGDVPGNRLKALIDIAQGAHKTHSDRRAQLVREQSAAQLALLGRLVATGDQTAKLLPDVLLAARVDLDLTIDATEYRRLFAEQHEAMVAAVHEVHEQLKQLAGQSTPAGAPRAQPADPKRE